jgi:5-(carboxyamino)imidazole ribonucleotide synthase
MARIGILGSGQLGRMLALAAHPLGHSVVVLGPGKDDPAMAVAEPIVAPFDDPAALDALASRVDVVTFEFENVPGASVDRLAAKLPVHPSRLALETGADRLAEKTLFRTLGIETAPFAAVDDARSLDEAVAAIGLPAILKTRRLGYDGKGQVRLKTAADVPGAFERLGGVPAILEGFVRFEREISMLGARGKDGSVVLYGPIENVHDDGILHVSRAPARGVSAVAGEAAERAIRAILEKLDYVGVLAVEMFLVGDHVIANETAPRVHNSGHFSIEGSETSQFENHVRAITGQPLGDTRLVGASAMVNLVGKLPDLDRVLAIPGTHAHVYGKSERPGRKIGHVTIRARTQRECEARLSKVLALDRWWTA